MSKLYERCSICGGTGQARTVFPAMVERCVCHNGFVPTGLTTGQVEALVARERQRLGDPGAAPVVTLRFRDEGARQLFITAVALLLGNDDDLRTFMMEAIDGASVLDASMIDVRIERIAKEE